MRGLHDLLMAYPEYRRQAVVVEGYFLPPTRPPVNPTVLDVVGPTYASRSREVHIENEILDVGSFEDRAAIAGGGGGEQAWVGHRGAFILLAYLRSMDLAVSKMLVSESYAGSP